MVEEKVCSKCNKLKSLDNFRYRFYPSRNKGYYNGKCKECRNVEKSEYNKKYWDKNKEELKIGNREYFKEYYKNNKNKEIERKKKWALNNPEKIKSIQKRHRNTEQYKINSRKYYLENKDKIINRQKEWAKKNNYYHNYNKKRKRVDSLYKLTCNIRTRIYQYAKGIKKYDNKTTIDLLGCDYNKLKEHLEEQFIDNMCWDNYGEWHIDHIIPLVSADNENELIELCNYKNLQPLWAKENLSKGSKIKEL